MGLIERMKRAFAGTTTQTADASWETYVDSVVTETEAIRARWRDVTTAREVAKRVHGPALGCALINARACASVPIRLYLPASAAKAWRGFKGRPVKDVRRTEYLRDFSRVGRKAALYAEADEDMVEVLDHPILSLLRRPNPDRTGTEFEVERWLHKWLFGNSVMLAVDGDAGPSGLVCLMPEFVRVQPDNERLIAGYYFGRSETEVVYFDAESIIHQRFAPHWNNPYWGMGPLDIVFRELDLYEFSLAAEQARWQKGGYPGGVLALKPPATQKQLDEASRNINRQIGGVGKSGSVAVTSDGTYTQLGKTNEMGYLPGMEYIERRVEREFGVPESLRRLNDANLASGQMGPDLYMSLTIGPSLAMDAEQLTELLLPRFGIEPGDAWLAYDDVTPADEESLRQDTAVYVPLGVTAVNEQRARLGYEPVPGGDLPRVAGVAPAAVSSTGVTSDFPVSKPAQTPSLAGTTAADTAASGDVAQTALNGAQVQALAELAANVTAGTLPADAARAIAEAAFPLVNAAILDRIFGSLDTFQPTVTAEPIKSKAVDDGLAAGLLTDSEQAKLIDGMRRTMEQWLTATMGSLKIGPDATVDLSGRDQSLSDALLPFVRRLVESGFAIGGDEVRAAGINPVRVSDQVAAEIVNRRGSLIIEQIRGTTEDQIRSAVLRGVDDQAPLNEVIDQLKSDLGEQAGSRAETIARTETSNAVGAGRMEVWKASGVTRKRWKLATDACEVCNALVALTGGEVGIDEPFAAAGTNLAGYTPAMDIQHNPCHPNCRCLTQPVL